MRIEKIRIKNFRSFSDVEINLSPYTSLVGPNGGGKSTILCALNIFFRETEEAATNLSDLDAEDFHYRKTDEPIEITVTFSDLSKEAQIDFAEYYRQEKLVVTAKATFDKEAGVANVKQFGQRSVMEAFTKFFKLYNDGERVSELREEYNNIRKKFNDLTNESTKTAMHDALREYEELHPDQGTLIASEDQFYGFSKGANRLSRHVQWVFVPAVKDATEENVEAKNTSLGKILARTVRVKVKFDEEIEKLKDKTVTEYQKIIKSQQSALDDISKSLTSRFKEWAHPEVKAQLVWEEDARKVQVDGPVARLITGEGSFEGELARFGHGLQRSYLLALLQELASTEDEEAPHLILGCEEPELYQHPPQARHLSKVLQELSNTNSQIIVSTHSPYFVSGRAFESVRMVRRDLAAKHTKVTQVTFEHISERMAEVTCETPTPINAQRARLQQALQPHLNEMFFAPKLILVEGVEDMSYITSWMILSDRWDDYRRYGCHIVPVNGKCYLIEPIIIAQALDISVFVVFDADGNKTNASERIQHEKDNKALLKLLGGDESAPFPDAILWEKSYVVWPTNLGDVIKNDVGSTDWDKTFGQATKSLGNPSGSFIKNPIHIADQLELLKNGGKIPASLEHLCDEIISFAKA